MSQDTTTANATGDIVYVSGYAVVYDKPSEVMTDKTHGNFVEYINAGALHEQLSKIDKNPIKLLVAHQLELVLASTESGTLKVWEDAKGIGFEAQLDPNQTYANDVIIAIGRRDIRGCSFYCNPQPKDQKWGKVNGVMSRVITRLFIPEITLTGFPAYSDTSCVVSSEPRKEMPPETRDKWNRIAEIKAKDAEDEKKAIAVEYARKLAILERLKA